MESGQRQYLPLLRAEHGFSDPALQELGALCTPSPSAHSKWSVAKPADMELRRLSFRLISRAGAVLYQSIYLEESRHPYPLLSLDFQEEPGELARSLLETPSCVLDPWTADFLKRHPTEGAMLSEDASAERETLLLMGRQCITRLGGATRRSEAVDQDILVANSCGLIVCCVCCSLAANRPATGRF